MKGKPTTEKIDDSQREPAAEEMARTQIVQFLVSHGIDDVDAKRMTVKLLSPESQTVAYWQGLLDEFGDFGGNVAPNGIRVRTPWLPPPMYWSSKEAAARYQERHGDLDEKIKQEEKKRGINADDEDSGSGEEY
eukprot:gnl/TRDRNA2_/TRDRNA2_66498_c0_seq1.p2 gnl/TRDRNA2_/TRDRNA2_66498_c0~~gnl/TRDRNA2_/TRDRNA2_66498_c0_seq1.p2  ORF type:complete len:134 (-),score=26.61 gnl/TRDRNA2_/TRDRNA2_66498_c0_seq1:386-787(-)